MMTMATVRSKKVVVVIGDSSEEEIIKKWLT
jgi:hypothetical protein